VTSVDDPIAPTDVAADLRRLLDHLTGGIQDPEAAKRARERMDRMREENRKRFGEQDAAVELIRQSRDRT
jgi:hypothetical protein